MSHLRNLLAQSRAIAFLFSADGSLARLDAGPTLAATENVPQATLSQAVTDLRT